MVLRHPVLALSNLSSTRLDIGGWYDEKRIIDELQRNVRCYWMQVGCCYSIVKNTYASVCIILGINTYASGKNTCTSHYTLQCAFRVTIFTLYSVKLKIIFSINFSYVLICCKFVLQMSLCINWHELFTYL